MSKRIIIYGKGGWPYTDKARVAFGNSAIYVDVTANADNLKEMLQFSGGRRQVPVIIENDKVTVGYGGSWGVWIPAGGRFFICRQVK